MASFTSVVYSYGALDPAPTTNVGSFWANFTDGSTVTVQTGAALTNSTGTMDVSDGPLGGSPDTVINDTGDDDQVLSAAVVINGVTYGDAGDAVQAESVTNITFSDGFAGQLVHINLRDTPTQDQPQSGEYVFVVLRETALGSGVFEKSTFTAGETFTVESTSGSGEIPHDVLCFGVGTNILTLSGAIEVQNLQAGAHIVTQTGTATLRAVISFKVPLSHMLKYPDQRPVRIERGALGDNIPKADLIVSPQHRILANSKIAERVTGTKEVLLAAKRLTVLPRVSYESVGGDMTYFHLLFDKHEIVYSEGMPTESMFLGEISRRGLETALSKLEYEAAKAHDIEHAEMAAFLPKGGKQKAIIRRHAKNEMALA